MADTVSSAASSGVESPLGSPEPPLSPPSLPAQKAPIELAPPKTGMTPPATPEGMSRMQAKRLGVTTPSSEGQGDEQQHQRQQTQQHQQSDPEQANAAAGGSGDTVDPPIKPPEHSVRHVRSHGVVVEVQVGGPPDSSPTPDRRRKTATEKIKGSYGLTPAFSHTALTTANQSRQVV